MTDAERLYEQAKLLLEHMRRIAWIQDNHPEWSLMAMQLGVTSDKFIDTALRSGFIDSDGNLIQDVNGGDLSAKDAQEMLKLQLIYPN
jgi:hypothetical protein